MWQLRVENTPDKHVQSPQPSSQRPLQVTYTHPSHALLPSHSSLAFILHLALLQAGLGQKSKTERPAADFLTFQDALVS